MENKAAEAKTVFTPAEISEMMIAARTEDRSAGRLNERATAEEKRAIYYGSKTRTGILTGAIPMPKNRGFEMVSMLFNAFQFADSWKEERNEE